MDTEPKAYSYIRFSTPDQKEGDSLRRQEKDAEDYAKKHGLTLDENQPDMVVVNVTKDQIWVRDGVIPDYPNVRPPNAAVSVEKYGGFVVPVPTYQREDLQSQFIRDAEIDPKKYYPKGYHPELMEHWPVEKPLFIPEDKIPDSMK